MEQPAKAVIFFRRITHYMQIKDERENDTQSKNPNTEGREMADRLNQLNKRGRR
jgi:hypothetical protein